MTNAIQKIETALKNIEGMTDFDLEVKENVDAIVKAAMEIAAQKKAADAADKKIKSEFKRICKPYTDNNMGVTCYSWDEEQKITVLFSGGGAEIDEDIILEKLYEYYGEERSNKQGQAWRAYCKISDPVERPRVLNTQKIEAILAENDKFDAHIIKEEPVIPRTIIERATVIKAPSIVCKTSKVSKTELEAHNKGEFDEIFVPRQY